MVQRFTRGGLYSLVWSEPMKVLAARYGISDVGLSKACRRHDIPVPERGHWAKLRVGKKVRVRPLPLRGPGMSEEVVVGAKNYWGSHTTHSDQEILDATPSPPVFERDIEEVTTEIREMVGRLTVAKAIPRPHRLIAKLLEADEERRQRAANRTYLLSWDQPLFDSPFERRRLRLLNAIFVASERCGMRPSVRGKEARDLSVQVNDQNVAFTVDDANVKFVRYGYEYQPCRNPSGRMKVVISSWRAPDHTRQVWEDTKGTPVEKFVTDIVVELIVAGECQYREAAQHRYDWMVERKAQLIEDARRRKEEEERQEWERLARLEKERVDRLLADASSLRQAGDIRAYVQEVRNLCTGNAQSVSENELGVWERWALAQADQLDPVVSGRFRESMVDPPELVAKVAH
jgi:hypothetical protein